MSTRSTGFVPEKKPENDNLARRVADLETRLSKLEQRLVSAENKVTVAENRLKESHPTAGAIISAEKTQEMINITCTKAMVKLYDKVKGEISESHQQIMDVVQKGHEWTKYCTADDAETVRLYREEVFSEQIGGNIKMITSGKDNDRIIAPGVSKVYTEDDF